MKRTWKGYLFAGPLLLGFLLFYVLPFGQVVWDSLSQGTGKSQLFVGLENYSRMLSDKNLRTAFLNNMFFLLLGTVFQMFMGLLMATLLSGIKKGSNLFRVLYFIPCININLILNVHNNSRNHLCSKF